MAAPSTLAATAALQVVEGGGGAVDAAVAASLVTMVAEPGIVSLAGGAFVTVWPAGPPTRSPSTAAWRCPASAGRPRAPVSVQELRTGYGGGVTMTVGLGSVAVPGALAALDLAQRQFGRLPWRDVVWPAQEVARDRLPAGVRGGLLPALRPGQRLRLGPGDRPCPAARRRRLGRHRRPDADRRAGRHGAADRRRGRAHAVRRRARGPAGRRHVRPRRPGHRRPTSLPTSRCSGPPCRCGPAAGSCGPTRLRRSAARCWRRCSPCSATARPVSDADDVAHLVAVQRRVLDRRRDRLDVADDRTAAAYDLLREVGWSRRAARRARPTCRWSTPAAPRARSPSSYGYGSGATVPGTGLWLNNCLGERELNRAAHRRPRAPGWRATWRRPSAGATTVRCSRSAARAPTASPRRCSRCSPRSRTAARRCRRPSTGPACTCTTSTTTTRLRRTSDGPRVQVEAEEDLPLPGPRPAGAPAPPAVDVLRRRRGSVATAVGSARGGSRPASSRCRARLGRRLVVRGLRPGRRQQDPRDQCPAGVGVAGLRRAREGERRGRRQVLAGRPRSASAAAAPGSARPAGGRPCGPGAGRSPGSRRSDGPRRRCRPARRRGCCRRRRRRAGTSGRSSEGSGCR